MDNSLSMLPLFGRFGRVILGLSSAEYIGKY